MKEKRIKSGFRVTFLMIVTFLTGIMAISPSEAAAKAKMKLSRTSMTMKNDDLKSIRIKNPQKKVKWKISTKKYGHIDTYGKKNSICEISTDGNGIAGKFTVTATVGKKKFKCKVTVKGAKKKEKDSDKNSTPQPTQAPQTTSDPQSTQAPQTTSDPQSSSQTSGTYEAGFDNIKNYIKKNGDRNTNYEKIINTTETTNDGSQYTWGIVYHESTDSLQFLMTGKVIASNGTGQIAVEMIMTRNASGTVSVKSINVIGDNTTVTAGFEGTANINKSTFTNKSSIDVTLTLGASTDSSLNSVDKNVCEASIRLGFSGWQLLLSKHGFKLADLGFTAY